MLGWYSLVIHLPKSKCLTGGVQVRILTYMSYSQILTFLFLSMLKQKLLIDKPNYCD